MTTQRSPGLFRRLAHGSLVKQILVGLVLGILLAWISKPAAEAVGLLGTLFVGALKAVAPILVLMLVMRYSNRFTITRQTIGQPRATIPAAQTTWWLPILAASYSVFTIKATTSVQTQG